jgi:hypothetical protein
MAEGPLHERLLSLDETLGDQARYLRIGDARIRIEGLAPELIQALERRWGDFLETADRPDACLNLTVVRGKSGGWLRKRKTDERYRIESVASGDRRVVLSYHFAICPVGIDDRWWVAVDDRSIEPMERILDNVMRYFTARVAAESGGIGLHAAGVLREGKVYLFAGPSRAGKTTAVSLSTGTTCLGDDMAIVLPGEERWLSPALPFDNRERIEEAPPRGLFPVAGVWRLYQSPQHTIRRPHPGLAVASLMGCATIPWAMPELADRLLAQAAKLVSGGYFGHLHFAKDSGFWDLLLSNDANDDGLTGEGKGGT